MNYSDWGENAHWYISLELTANNSYSWFVEVSNLCAIAQSYSDVFTTDCQNTLNGTSEDLGCGCGEYRPNKLVMIVKEIMLCRQRFRWHL